MGGRNIAGRRRVAARGVGTIPSVSGAPLRGDIYWVDFNPARGSEQAGVRPGCVVSIDSFNATMPVVTVAAVTSKVKNFRVALKIPAGSPLPLESEILAFQLVSVDKSRLRGYIGSLDAQQVADLKQKLRLCWDL